MVLLSLLLSLSLAWAVPGSTRADRTERRLARQVQRDLDQGIALLSELVAIESGTFQLDGVRAVGARMDQELAALGFQTRWEELPPELGRAGHLVAVHPGTGGPKLLLIGHLDTVRLAGEGAPDFKRDGDRATGRGVLDMKGGLVTMWLALRALHAEGRLEDLHIAVILSGDEEDSGKPTSISRATLVELAREADIALGFEGGIGASAGEVVVARRSSSKWYLEVRATAGHSSRIGREEVGWGAAFELARVLDGFRQQVPEELLTLNPGLLASGSEVELSGTSGSLSGRTNVVAAEARAWGDLRAISDDQLQAARERMRGIVADSLPGAVSEIRFEDGYPPMPPTDANLALLAELDAVDRALGGAGVTAMDPGARGAADISFAAPHAACLSGLGPLGSGAHGPVESLDLASLPVVAQRTALLVHRLGLLEEPP